MTKITLSSFTRETLEENIKPYRQQIQNGSVKLIQSEKTADLIHADTFDQMETYLQSYFGFIWLGFQMRLPPDKLQESITAYVESWDKAKKQDAMTNEFNITGDLQGWISLFVREIYLQPIYCYEARKEYPDTLPYETLIFQRFLYLRDKTTFFPQKYSELSQKEYRKYRKLLSAGNKEAIRDVKNILLFTENLLSEIPAYLYGSPILTAFIKAMLDFKKTYSFILPNEGLPLIDKYFDNIYTQQFTVDFFPFEKDLTPQPEPLTGKTEQVITDLKRYNLPIFLTKKGYSERDIYQLINKHSGKELMPYTITLLDGLGYLQYFINEYSKTRSQAFKILADIFKVSPRRIKGNVNILTPGSTEDRIEYTSIQHKEKVLKELSTLKTG